MDDVHSSQARLGGGLLYVSQVAGAASPVDGALVRVVVQEIRLEQPFGGRETLAVDCRSVSKCLQVEPKIHFSTCSDTEPITAAV